MKTLISLALLAACVSPARASVSDITGQYVERAPRHGAAIIAAQRAENSAEIQRHVFHPLRWTAAERASMAQHNREANRELDRDEAKAAAWANANPERARVLWDRYFARHGACPTARP